MDVKEVEAVLAESESGQLVFPRAIQRLVTVGIESYCLNLTRGEARYYSANGDSHLAKTHLSVEVVAPEFAQAELVSALCEVQADRIRYPDFVRRIRAAGVAAYWVFLSGRRVIYLSRTGEIHVEEFPRGPK